MNIVYPIRHPSEQGSEGTPRPITTSRPPHWPALDGIRAVAILSVMVFHFGHAYLLPGGYLGVDVFFVLSGFLISSLLLAEWDSSGHRINFRNFYLRRVLRLGPALVVAIIAATVLAEIDGGTRGRRRCRWFRG